MNPIEWWHYGWTYDPTCEAEDRPRKVSKKIKAHRRMRNKMARKTRRARR